MIPSVAARLSTLLMPLFFLACGGGEASSAAKAGTQQDGVEITDSETAGHHLIVTVDGTRFEARGRPFGSAMRFASKEVQVQVGGPLVSAMKAGKSTSLGDFDLKMNIKVNAIDVDTYEMVSRLNAARLGKKPAGHIEIFFPGSAPFTTLRPKAGSITLQSVNGQEEGKRYVLKSVSGKAQGTFLDEASAEHQVEIEFSYVR